MFFLFFIGLDGRWNLHLLFILGTVSPLCIPPALPHSEFLTHSCIFPLFFFFLVLWEPFDVDVHSAAYAHFYFYATRGMGRERIGAGVVQGGVFGMCVFSFGGCRGWKWVGMQTEIVTPLFLSLLSSLSFPGGLYGWKWGVLSAASFAQTVPAPLPED